MNNIPQEVINDIRSRARIEEVIGSFITVQRKGNNYIAYCPFHDDHNPSLHINVSMQLFKCFSCPAENGSAGDVFKFVEKYKHVTFPEAVKIVAEKIGYQYDFGDTGKKLFVESITHRLNRETIAFCQYELTTKAGKPFREYLNNRHIDDELIDKYAIGYNPAGDKLTTYLTKKGYQDKDIIEANLGRMTSSGMKDVFANRIMIPVYDGEGHAIGFTARTLDPDTTSKYINTAETPVFRKSNVLFNLHRAKEVVREKKFMIICEGPMDVMALERGGYGNAVCSMGTATTDQQIMTIKRLTNKLLLAYDGDKAGQSAIYRTGQMALEKGMEVTVLNNNTELDPDEIINTYGKGELAAMIEKPKNWMDFILEYFRKQYDLSNYNHKREYISVIMKHIDQLSDAMDRENYKRRLSELTGVNYSLLSTEGTQQSSGPRTPANKPEISTGLRMPMITNGLEIAQKTIIRQMLLSNRAIEIFKQQLSRLPDSRLNELAMQIIDYASQHSKIVISELSSQINDEMQSLLYDISDDEMFRNEFDEETLNDAVIEIKIGELTKEKNEISKQIEMVNDGVVKGKYSGQRNEINMKIKELRSQKSQRVRRKS
ncbi:MAG: DNA primase [Erysipelotrichaceae bacterium]|nr:DNA primase [Erysipelotrichaceae bacterium]